MMKKWHLALIVSLTLGSVGYLPNVWAEGSEEGQPLVQEPVASESEKTQEAEHHNKKQRPKKHSKKSKKSKTSDESSASTPEPEQEHHD